MTDRPTPADPPAPPDSSFAQEHALLDSLLHEHLLDVMAGDLPMAHERLQRWRSGLTRHIEIENQHLLPHVPEGARWAARVYLLEHERISLLADEYADRVSRAAHQPLPAGRAHQATLLKLIDSAHALRHVLEHHHEREQTALAHELPQPLQQAAWKMAHPQVQALVRIK